MASTLDLIRKKREELEAASGDNQNKSSSQSGTLAKIRQFKAQSVAQEIQDRLNGWNNSLQSLYGDYSDRYKGDTGAYRAYRSDYAQWNSKVFNSTYGFDKDYDYITNALNDYGEYLDTDWVNNVRDYVQGNYQNISNIKSAAKQDYDIFSQFDDEETYNTWAQQKTWEDKYSGKDYSEMVKDLGALPSDSAEAQWLSEYSRSDDVMTVDILDKELSDKKAQLDWYNTNNEFTEAYDQQGNYYQTAKYTKEINALHNEIEQLQAQKWRISNRDKYAAVAENKDFNAVSSAVDKSINNYDYHYINDINGFRNKESARAMRSGGNNATRTFDYMTDDEVNTYNYLYHSEGKKAAKEYLEYLSYDLNARATDENKRLMSAFADELPVTASILSVPANLMSIVGYADALGQNIARGISGEYRPIDYNTVAMSPSNSASAIRGTVAQNIADATGVIQLDREKNPLLSTIFNGKSLGDVYQLGMSMADSAAIIPLGGAGTVLLGGSAATQGMLDAVARGASDSQALTMGFLNGAFETLFEKVSLDNLLSGNNKNVVSAIFKQGFIEGSEEFNTTLANNIADILVMAQNSNYEKNISAYMANGLSEEEARKQALLDMCIEMAWDFAGGVISGGVMGGAAAPIQSISQKSADAKAMYGSDLEALVAEALELNPNSKFAKFEQNRVAKGKDISGLEIMGLVEQNNKAIIKQDVGAISTAAQTRLSELGETGDITAIASALAKEVSGKKLSKKETELISSIKYGQRVRNELNPENIRSEGYSSAWAEKIDTSKLNAEEYSRLLKEIETPTEAQTVENEQVIDEGAKTTPTPENGEILKASQQNTEATPTEAQNAPVNVLSNEAFNAAQVENADTDEAIIKEYAKGYGEYAGDYIHTYEPGQDVKAYDIGFEVAFSQGKSGVPFNDVLSGAVESPTLQKLSKTQLDIAYTLGAKEAAKAAGEQSVKILSGANGKTGRRKGVVKGQGVTIADLKKTFNDKQNVAYKLLASYAEATGIDIVLYNDDTVNEKGEYTAVQGKFKSSEDTIYININAGLSNKNDVKNLSQYTMLRTFSHEFVHFIEKYNPVEYNVFRRFVFNKLTERGENVHELIARQMELNESLTYEKASREVVAEAMTDILPDSNLMQELAENHQNIFQELLAKLKEFIETLKEHFKGYRENPASEANALKEEIDGTIKYLDDIVAAYDKLAKNAVSNYQATVATDEAVTETKAEAKTEAKAEPKTTTSEHGFTVTDNAEYGSLEISFEGKPSEAIRNVLKENKFKWHKQKAVWYGYAERGAITDSLNKAYESETVDTTTEIVDNTDDTSIIKSETIDNTSKANVKPVKTKKSDWSAHDVEWTVPGRKTPIAYSTSATNDLIKVLAEDNPNATISEIKDMVRYDVEAKKVLQQYIDSGYGNQVASEWFLGKKSIDIKPTENIEEAIENGEQRLNRKDEVAARETKGKPTGAQAEVGNRREVQGGVQQSSGEVGQLYREFWGRRQELSQTEKRYSEDSFITPQDGTVEAEEYGKLAEYGIEGYVVNKSVWDSKAEAFAVNGRIYIREGINEIYRGLVVEHEATHVMKQMGFPLYTDFLERTPGMLNIASENGSGLLEQAAEHYGLDLFDLTGEESLKLYDEINARVYCHYMAGQLVDESRNWVPGAFYDFDSYIEELANIHKMFKEAIKNGENADNNGTVQPAIPDRQGDTQVLDEQQTEDVQGNGDKRNAVGSTSERGREAGRNDNRPNAERVSGGPSQGDSESRVHRGNDVLTETSEAEPQAPETEPTTLHDVVTEQIEQKSTEQPKGSNFVINKSLDLPSGEKSRYKANVEAIKLIKKLEAEGRYATAAEQEILSKYVGWGGLANAFDNRKSDWAKEYAELKELLTDEEYSLARGSTLNAHYTEISVIKAMYDGLKQLGFTGGRMLEPSSGTGNFVGAMPTDMSAGVKSWTMVELDSITGRIAKYLYPNADVRIQGFEKANIPDNYMDVAISNVPFGNYAITDKKYPKKVTSAIHNYFFAKTLDKVRPGGIVMFITSSYTMNSKDSTVRKYIMERADLLGAIRLPDTAFKGNAGTEVVTDIIVLKKRADKTNYEGESFETADYQYFNGYNGAYINNYFKEHPEMVLGTPEMTGGMYRGGSLTYKAFTDKGSLADQIRKAFENIQGKMEYPFKPTPEKTNFAVERATKKAKNDNYVVKDDKIYKYQDGDLVEQTVSAKAAEKIKGLLDIRDAHKELATALQQGQNENSVKAARKALNKAYDDFVKKHGYINAPGNKNILKGDPDKYSILSLENYDSDNKVGKKADIFTTNTIAPNRTVTQADSVAEGLIVSRNETGGVDVNRIAQLTGKTAEDVTRELIDTRLAFKNRNGELEAAEVYLSGNVRAKLRDAEALIPFDEDYKHNVEALKNIIPEDVKYQDIFCNPGTPWIPDTVYSDFAAYMLGSRNTEWSKAVDITRNKETGNFVIELKNNYLKTNSYNTQKWGTPQRSFIKLFEAMLNSKSVVVKYKTDDGQTIIDKDATAAANEKIENITKEFQDWLWRDETRRTELTTLYNETFNSIVTPKYNGDSLTVDGANAMKPLRPHQRDAVQRVISSGGNTLLAHKVGAGKTYEMAAAAMKLKQLGLVKKPMFVVPKPLVEQWGIEFLDFFPTAKLLVTDASEFSAANRKVYANRIANGNFDAVIVSYEQFERLPMSSEYELHFYEEEMETIIRAIQAAKEEKGDKSMSVKDLEKKRKSLQTKIDKLTDIPKDADNIEFEQLGVDSIFVDEAHNFKNLFYTTSMTNVSGLSNSEGAKRSFDLYMKVRYLQQLNGGRGVVFATATPVMNSMAEMYIMQKYLQPDLLNQLGLTTFDSWAKQFGEVVNGVEIKPSGQGYRVKQSFSRFKNMSELQLLFRNFADVLTDIPGLKIPKMKGGQVKVVVCEPGQFQQDYMKELEERADNIKNVDPTVDNMLKITSDGRKISYTQRMIDPSLPYEEGCKIYRCADNIVQEYRDSKGNKGTQLVFMDMATPKGASKNNTETEDVEMDMESAKLYDDLKAKLIKSGIPAKEIAFIHDADTADKKKKLFADVNEGKVRVLIGSTGKMGVGMNAQRRVVAIHHLDAPWRPGDVEQRNGRAFRQGNINDEVSCYTYVTEGSFDARLWDILDRKSQFINQIMNGENVGRETEDTGEVTLSAAEVKALASGSPLILEQVQLETDIKKLESLRRSYNSAIIQAKEKLAADETLVAEYTKRIADSKIDAASIVDTYSDEKKFSLTVGKAAIKDKKTAGIALMTEAQAKATTDGYTTIGKFAGFDLRVVKTHEGIKGLVSGKSAYSFKLYPDNTTYMITQLTAVIEGIKGNIELMSKALEATKADMVEQQKLIGEPFKKQAELDEKRSRYNEVMAILNPKEEQALDNIAEDDVQNQARRPYDERKGIDVRKTYRTAKSEISQTYDNDEGAEGNDINDINGNRNSGGTSVISRQAFGNEFRNDTAGSVSGDVGNGRGTSLTDDQNQERRKTYSDREVLAIAAERVGELENLTDGQRDALKILKKRLDRLEELQIRRTEIGQQYKELQFGAKVDREKAAETLKMLNEHKAMIEEAENEVLKAEDTEVLKRTLKVARKFIESQEKEAGQEILRRYRERRENAAAVKKYRTRIKLDVDTLTKWILHPSNKDVLKHVPDALKSSVIPFLSSIDFTSKRMLAGGEATKADIVFMQQLKSLRNALNENFNASGAYSGYNDLPPEFMENLQRFIDTAQTIVDNNKGTYVINEMTAEELKSLSKLVRTLKKFIIQMNQFHANAMFEHVYEAGDSSIEFMNKLDTAKHTGLISDFTLWQQIRPAYAFERFGEGGIAIYDGLRKGQATLAFNTKKITDFAEKAYTAAEVKAWEEETKTFRLGGDTVIMPISHIMSFYELSKRPQALGHILGAGVRVATVEVKDGKKKKKVYDTGHTLTESDIEVIIKALTPRQKAVADSLQQFMAKQGGAWGNYVSLKRFGEEMFGEEHYFPINSDGQRLQAEAEKHPTATSLYALLNMSFTKELQEKANNRIILYSIFDVFSNHMSGMAQYNAFALPILDALKWFNYQTVEVDSEGNKSITGSVREEMARAFGVPVSEGGKEGMSYAERFVMHILQAFNGTEAQGSPKDAIGVGILHRYNISQVAYNFRVVVQQPLAIARAGLLVDYKSIIKGLKLSPSAIKTNIEEMQKYSGIAAWKALGFYDINISRGVTQLIKHDESFMDKVTDIGMWGAEKADTVTWAAIWSACKEEVIRKQHLRPSSAGFYEAVSALFEDVIYKTQVVDSVLTKNEWIRDKGYLARTLGAFMSEPTTTASMLIDTFDKYVMDIKRGLTNREAWKNNSKKIGRVATVYAVSQILLAAVQSIIDAFRDDDDYENYWEKYLEALKGNLIDELNPFNKLPIIGDFVELIKSIAELLGADTYGNTSNSTAAQIIDYTIKGSEIIIDKIKGEDTNYTWWGGIYKLLQATSGATGLPMGSASRELTTAWNSTVGYFAPSYKAKTYKPSDKSSIKYAYLDGYLTPEETIQQLVETGAAENKDEAYWTVQGWASDNPNFSKYSNLYNAALTGGNYYKAVNELKAHGTTDKDIQRAIRSKITQWFTDGEITESEAKRMYTKYGNMTDTEAKERIEEIKNK